MTVYTVSPNFSIFYFSLDILRSLFIGTDCSIPKCVQGIWDHECRGVAPGGEGCFRCANGGNCTAPDFCTCPPEWSGYDCNTPVCIAIADSETVWDLKTVDLAKIQNFEFDPCQSKKLHVHVSFYDFLLGFNNVVEWSDCVPSYVRFQITNLFWTFLIFSKFFLNSLRSSL